MKEMVRRFEMNVILFFTVKLFKLVYKFVNIVYITICTNAYIHDTHYLYLLGIYYEISSSYNVFIFFFIKLFILQFI